MKNLFYSIVLIIFISSCGKDDPEITNCDKVEGVWRAESYQIDGTETIGSLFQSIEFDFDHLSGGKGDFQFKYIYSNGQTEVTTGKYEPNTTCNELDINGYSMDFNFIGEKLNIEGNLAGYAVKSKLKRT